MGKEIEIAEELYNQAFDKFMFANTDVCATRDFLVNLQNSYKSYQKEIVKYKELIKNINDSCKKNNLTKEQMPWERIKNYLNVIGYYKTQLNNCQKQIIKTKALLRKYETRQNVAYHNYESSRSAFTKTCLQGKLS